MTQNEYKHDSHTKKQTNKQTNKQKNKQRTENRPCSKQTCVCIVLI